MGRALSCISETGESMQRFDLMTSIIPGLRDYAASELRGFSLFIRRSSEVVQGRRR